MKKITKQLIAIFVIVILLMLGAYAYTDWHSKEYPSGDLIQSTSKIDIFYGGWYCDFIFIQFDDVFQFANSDDATVYTAEEGIRYILDNNNVGYNITYGTWCDDNTEIRIILNESVDFIVSYHTYDRMLAGNEISYAKTKVFEKVYVKPLG